MSSCWGRYSFARSHSYCQSQQPGGGHSSLRCWTSAVAGAQLAWSPTISPVDLMGRQTLATRHASALALCLTIGWVSRHSQQRACRLVFSSVACVPPSHCIAKQMTDSSCLREERSERHSSQLGMGGRARGERQHSSDFEMAAVHVGLALLGHQHGAVRRARRRMLSCQTAARVVVVGVQVGES